MKKTTTTDVIFDHEKMTFSHVGFTAEIRFDKVTEVTIAEEADPEAGFSKVMIPIAEIDAEDDQVLEQREF